MKSINMSDKICFVHPSIWRKPYSKKSKVKDLLTEFKKYNLAYLNINSLEDGKKIFNAGTRFDYYYLDKKTEYINTIVVDDKGVISNIDIREYDFIPNHNILNVKKYFSNDNYEVIFNSMYHSVRDYVSDIKDDVYYYPLIHSTPKSGIVYKYSSINNKGHFGIPKVIIGESGVFNLVIDLEGKYGMTQGSIGIVVENLEEANRLSIFLLSNDFKELLKSCSWSNFRIDAGLIKMLKRL